MSKPKRSFRWAWFGTEVRHFVSASFTGPKKRIKIRLNTPAQKAAVERRKRVAAKRRAEKSKKERAKRRATLRTKAAKKFGIRSKGKFKRRNSTRTYQAYTVPFQSTIAYVNGQPSIEWVVSQSAVVAVFDVEAAAMGEVPPSIAGWVLVSFKDEPEETQWIPVGASILADEPGGGVLMWEQIMLKVGEYEIDTLHEVSLNVSYSEKEM